jgi:nucleoside-diphosphate-sugar epimerase
LSDHILLCSFWKKDSKAIAEKAAWDFMQNDHSGLELYVFCPGLILGPLLEEDFSASANVVIKMMDGSLPAVPKIGYDIVDVTSRLGKINRKDSQIIHPDEKFVRGADA